MLANRFKPFEFYSKEQSDTASQYKLLPFNFERKDSRYFLTNLVGEYVYLSNDAFRKFVNYELPSDCHEYHALKAKHFLFDSNASPAVDLLGIKLRTKYQNIRRFTGLHIFVTTLRCDYSCPYCQVSRQCETVSKYDMSEEIALKAIDLVFKSPNPSIKIEFQGGEPLLNLPLIKFIVNNVNEKNVDEKRNIEFVIATNLSHINEEILEYCDKENIYISTSLDGPEWLHNKNRPRPGKNGYELTVKGIKAVREKLGPDKISALMTTTEDSLQCVKDIIDEYLANGFDSIFLRSLSPYGFAVKTKAATKYDVADWINFYKEGIEYILSLNKKGIPVREQFASIILTKMLTPYEPGFVDLQSPTGAVTGALVYNYDGGIYASDEARMLAEMDDETFRLGDVYSDSYEEIIGSDFFLDLIDNTILNSVPMCSDCAYQMYCGSDPIYHYATQKDFVGHKAFSGFCQKNMAVYNYLLELLDRDDDTRDILYSWARK